MLFALVLSLAIFSCKKTVVDPTKSDMEILAKNVLKEKMTPNDFASLNWSNVSIQKFHERDFLVEVSSTTDADKKLYFSTAAGAPVYNWAKFEKKAGANGKMSGTLTISNVSNEVLNKFIFIDNRVVSQHDNQLRIAVTSNGSKPKTFVDESGDGTELPPVSVTGYIHSSYYDYNSLYWLFNMNMSFLPFFEGGGGNDMPILDANYSNSGPYKAYATRDILTDGKAQITNTNPNAFLLSGLKLTFTYDPASNALNTSSVSATTTGLFAGTWTGPTINNITSTSSSISFWFTYSNSYDLLGLHFNKDYKMQIDYNTTTNEITWTWQP